MNKFQRRLLALILLVVLISGTVIYTTVDINTLKNITEFQTWSVALAIGFIAAFVSGCLACKWMINIVKKGKLIWFAAYCVVAGIFAIILNYTL